MNATKVLCGESFEYFLFKLIAVKYKRPITKFE